MTRIVALFAVGTVIAMAGAARPQPAQPKRELPAAPGPRTPAEELATFRVAKGFEVQLVASEPDVIDPVSMCFDEKGRLFVCEMRGYPNAGVGTGNESRGRIKCLEDRDGDGRFETVTTFAEGLRFPMGIQPYKNGLIVAVAPDMIYLEDTNADGKADRSTVWYTGFNLANIQQMVNSVQWGLDNWIYACAGSDGGVVTSPQKPDQPAVSLRNRGLRFRPGAPGSLEPTSSGGQYGLTADDYGRWFTATNSQHLRQIVLPEHYLRRNAYLPVTAVTLDIPEHGAAAKVFRISPFEPWRVERTTRRAGSPDAKRFPPTELVPGGYITSACSPLIYTAQLLRGQYGYNFVCDPANNLIHRERLDEKGAVFQARRIDPESEFLASTDNWFRPVHLSIGPDGAIYVLDFYREVIETPLSLPDDIKKQLNLESRERGRIWRIAPSGFKPGRPTDFTQLNTTDLVKELLSTNSARRLTAQRLVVERGLKSAAPLIRQQLKAATGKPGRVNLLWTLDGLKELADADVIDAMGDPNPGVREQALRLAEPFMSLRNVGLAAARLAQDEHPRVRFQLALSAGFMNPTDAAPVLAKILSRPDSDSWTQTAALSSAGRGTVELLEVMSRERGRPDPVLGRLAAIIGAKGETADIIRVLNLSANPVTNQAVSAQLLDGVGQGMRNTKAPLPTWWGAPPPGSEDAIKRLRQRFTAAAKTVESDASPASERLAAAGLLAYGPYEIASPALANALTPSTPGDVQLAAVRSLAAHADPKVSETLLANWSSFGPVLRKGVLDLLLTRPDRTITLLDAIEKQRVARSELDAARVQQLKMHPNPIVRDRATALFKAVVNPDRAKVIAEYTAALELKGDAARGKTLFGMKCSACHRLDGVGNDVGANLIAALPNKSGEDLLVAVLDPNREIDPRYISYLITTTDGRVLTGVLAVETPTSVTIRRADGGEDTILRTNLESLRSTRLSLMPEGLEKELNKQELADVFAYLRTAGK